MIVPILLAGFAAAVGARALMCRILLVKFRSDVKRLNAGDYEPLLASYADDAVLHFNDGEHRWAGAHRGKPAIDRFLRDFVAAGVQGEILDLWLAGPPWALRMVARFDDGAQTSDGSVIYRNRTAIVVHTRFGKITEQWDFYEDTGRITDFDQALNAVGLTPVTA